MTYKKIKNLIGWCRFGGFDQFILSINYFPYLRIRYDNNSSEVDP